MDPTGPNLASTPRQTCRCEEHNTVQISHGGALCGFLHRSFLPLHPFILTAEGIFSNLFASDVLRSYLRLSLKAVRPSESVSAKPRKEDVDRTLIREETLLASRLTPTTDRKVSFICNV